VQHMVSKFGRTGRTGDGAVKRDKVRSHNSARLGRKEGQVCRKLNCQKNLRETGGASEREIRV
jgi:hypothetical protein